MRRISLDTTAAWSYCPDSISVRLMAFKKLIPLNCSEREREIERGQWRGQQDRDNRERGGGSGADSGGGNTAREGESEGPV
jgi:hypothetical protein